MATLVGLQDIYYAKLKKDDAEGTTYDTPVKLGHAIRVDLTHNTATATQYGDNMAVATVTKLNDVSITIDTTDIPLKDKAILLGQTFDSVTGSITGKGDDAPPYVAILFEANKSTGGSIFRKYYKGKFAPANQTINTQTDNIEFQTTPLDGTFIARDSDGKFFYEIDTDIADNASIVSAWFDSV